MYKYYFEKTEDWNRSIDFTEQVFRLTGSLKMDKKTGLSSQLNRASLSIANNLAEGLSRKSYKEQARFTNISYSSLMECLNMVILCKRLELLDEKKYNDLRAMISEISNKLNALHNAQVKRSK